MTDLNCSQEASRRLAAIVESTDDGVMSATVDGIVTSWNRGAQRILGWASHEAVGRRLSFFIPPEREGEERRVLDTVAAGRGVESFETCRMRRDGSRVDVSVTYSAVRSPSGAIEGVSAILREVARSRAQASDEPATDQLTGVLDERELHRRLNVEIARFENVHAPFTLLLVEVGADDDELARRRALRAVASALAGACRTDDPIYRNGAEGFAALLQGSAGAGNKAVKGRAEQAVHGLELDVHVSFALAEWPYDGPSRDRFLAGARDGRADARAILATPRAAAGLGVGARHGEIASVRALLAALVARDGSTGGHSEKVVSLASDLARSLSLTEHEIDEVEQVALLHDLGKIGISASILGKKGPLDATEWEIVREHPEVGAQIVAGLPSLAHLAPLVRAAHERWDGRGYPYGLAGDQVPLPSRMVLACDAYQAMTRDRPYRRALSIPDALRELERNAGSQFDPFVVASLLRVLERKRHGAPVLANRRTGKSRRPAYVA